MDDGGIWPNWEQGLKGCFVREQGTSWTAAQFAAREATLVEWLEEWETASGLAIEWLSDCPAPVQDAQGKDDYRGADGKVVFRFLIDVSPKLDTVNVPGNDCTNEEDGGNWGAFPDSETSGRTWKYCQYNGSLWAHDNKNKMLHEMGHKLGFIHEHERPDTDGSCTPAPGVGNNVYLTYDDLESVMGYDGCGYNSIGSEGLSAGDKLGAEILYPHSLEPKISGGLCFGLICRQEVTLTTDWNARGAHPSVLNGTEWWESGTWTSGQTLSRNFSAGLRTVKVRFTDHLARDHEATHFVTADDSQHTGIVSAL